MGYTYANKEKEEIYEILLEFDADDVLDFLVNYHGTRILDRGFLQYLKKELGYEEYDEESYE